MSTVEELLADPIKLTTFANSVFRAIDTDHSGAIEVHELRTAMNYIADCNGFPRPSGTQVAEAMEQLDTNRSGSIDLSEFEAFIRSVLRNVNFD